MFYNTNGIPSDLPHIDRFWIEYHSEFGGNFIFKEGDIVADIDSKCVELNYEIAKRIFGSVEAYYQYIQEEISEILRYGGIDAEVKISKEDFKDLIKKLELYEVANKLLYYYDITNLLGTLQNSLIESRYLVGQFYKLLNENSFLLSDRVLSEDGIKYATGPIVTNITSIVNHIFINLYSQLDFLTKFIFEFEHLPVDFTTYPQLKSKDVTFKQAKKTKLAGLPGSLFEQNTNSIMIMALRNEIVHNSSIDSMPKVYQMVENKQIIEKFILLPDMNNGALISLGSRKRFFDQDVKLNEILPKLIIDFWQRLKVTLDAVK